jgi:hypothetical protein
MPHICVGTKYRIGDKGLDKAVEEGDIDLSIMHI